MINSSDNFVRATRLENDEHLVVVSRGVAVAGPDLAHALDLPVGTFRDVRFVGARHRVSGRQIVARSEDVSIYALSPKPDPAVGELDSRLLLFAFGAVAFVAILAYLVGRTYRRVELEAETDPLTGLPRRRRFLETLSAEIRRVERSGGSLALICADIDSFKTVNDRFGHEAGDDVLRCSPTSSATASASSTFPRATVARSSRFFCLRPTWQAPSGLPSVSAPNSPPRRSRHATPSSGSLPASASRPSQVAPKSELLHAADQALYHAKRNGKNRVLTTND